MQNMNTIDWVLCLAWSLGHAILTALVGHTAANADVTYDSIRATGSRGPVAYRWIGRCKTCRTAHRVDGMLAVGHAERRHDQIVVSGTACYLTSGNGTDPSSLWVACCTTRARLSRVYDSHKPNRPRHECNAKCMASTGPACECKCGGAKHGSSARAVA